MAARRPDQNPKLSRSLQSLELNARRCDVKRHRATAASQPSGCTLGQKDKANDIGPIKAKRRNNGTRAILTLRQSAGAAATARCPLAAPLI